MRARYPEELATLGEIDQALAAEVLTHTEEMLRWLSSK